MQIIIHRVNQAAALQATPPAYGVEIDLRTYGERLVLNHEPKRDGELFADWLAHYRHGTLILNAKEEGLEDEILELVASRGIEDFFFLDLTGPMMVRLARRGESRFAVRYSEYESLETCLRFAGLARWAWIDCFTHAPLDSTAYAALREHFKLCLVAPELEGHDPRLADHYRSLLRLCPMDAVCTDFPELWTDR
jgi:hypothetical protein